MVAAVLAAGCGGGRADLDRQAEAYARIVLALGERDRDSLDFFAGPQEWLADARVRRTPLADIKRSAAALVDEIGHSRSSRRADSRRRFLIGQLRAVIARIDILSGRRFGFDEESRLLFGVDPGTRDPHEFERARRELDRLLPGGGDLGPRYTAFDRRFIVPRDRQLAVIDRAVEGCRRVTLDHLSLPAGEHVTIEYVRAMPWSAFTTYEGHGHSRTKINTDFELTVNRALELACHETYPGHHAINTLVDARLVEARHQLELTALPLFSPQSLRTEGAATFAPELAFPPADRLRFERDALFPLAGLKPADAELYLHVSRLVDRLRWLHVDVARRYLDGTLEFVRAASRLEEEALTASADATLKFFNQFRSYAITYTVGRDLVAQSVKSWRDYERWVTETP